MRRVLFLLALLVTSIPAQATDVAGLREGDLNLIIVVLAIVAVLLAIALLLRYGIFGRRSKKRFCEMCGTAMHDWAEFCPKCGKVQKREKD
jgi:rRNA maturation endonuclease Nob1